MNTLEAVKISVKMVLIGFFFINIFLQISSIGEPRELVSKYSVMVDMLIQVFIILIITWL